MRPDLGEIERIPRKRLGLRLAHHLDAEAPARKIAALDGLEEAALVRFAVPCRQGAGLGVGEAFDALQRLEVELAPHPLAVGVDEAVGVAAVAVEVTVRSRQAAVREQDRHLVQGFRAQRPEIPLHVQVAQVGLRVALLGVDELGELVGVADEEHRGVVAHHVPVALLGVELQGKAAHVALRVRGAALAGHGGEAQKRLGLLAHLGEKRGARVARHVVGDREGAVRRRALGVHHALRDALAVEMLHLLQKLHVLHEQRAARPRGQGILVIGDGRAVGGGQDMMMLTHDVVSSAVENHAVARPLDRICWGSRCCAEGEGNGRSTICKIHNNNAYNSS